MACPVPLTADSFIAVLWDASEAHFTPEYERGRSGAAARLTLGAIPQKGLLDAAKKDLREKRAREQGVECEREACEAKKARRKAEVRAAPRKKP